MSYIVIDGDTREAVCPTGAVTIKDETDKAREIFAADKETTRVVVEVAPAVRAALGEKFGMARGENAMGKIVAGLRILGADIVADGAFAADFIVSREADELKERLETGENLPLFSSFCPAWVHYAERKYPQLKAAFSAFRSPMRTFGKALKAHFDALGDGKETKVIAVMPCAAEKCEEVSEEVPSVDLVLTTEELAEMFKKAELNVRLLPPQAADQPFGVYTGAGILTGVSGGVAEAAARRLSEDKSEDALAKIRYSGLRGGKELREAEIKIGEKTAKVAVVYGLRAAGELAEKLIAGEAEYDFVEVTACPEGCVSGGGQPCLDVETEKLRAAGLYYADRRCEVKSPELNETAEKFFCPPAETEAPCEYEEMPAAQEIPQETEAAAEEELAETPAEETPVPEPEETAEEATEAQEPCASEETEAAAEDLPEQADEELPVNDAETETEFAAEDVAEDIIGEEEPLEELFEEEMAEEAVPETAVSEEAVTEEAVTEAPTEDPLPKAAAEEAATGNVAAAEEIAAAETAPETAESESADEENEENEGEGDEAEPYHKTLSRKERRKLKRMKKFRR